MIFYFFFLPQTLHLFNLHPPCIPVGLDQKMKIKSSESINQNLSQAQEAALMKNISSIFILFHWHVLFPPLRIKRNGKYETTVLPTMAPIRWAASAPLLPPLRHLTRSIVRRNGECVSEFTQQQQQDPPLSGADDRRRLGFIEARLRASDTIGRPHVVQQRDLRKSISETQSLTPANSYQLALRVKSGTVLSAPKNLGY